MEKKNKILLVMTALLLFAGLALLCYPSAANAINQRHSSYAIQQLNEQMDQHGAAELDRQRSMAELYNAALRDPENGTGCPYPYEEILSFGNGIIGYLDIPAIGVHLPIYHGTSEEVLALGIGHLSDTAFPIGGIGNHSVLTGHTGLPSARLFTDLTELTAGDRFSITILNQTLTYEIDQIQIVLPSETDLILPISGLDCCTLVTCTPYGINSHRLLVRGVRVS